MVYKDLWRDMKKEVLAAGSEYEDASLLDT